MVECRDPLLCPLSFSSNLPGNFALKNGGDFGEFFWYPSPRNEAQKLLKKFGENSEQNSGQNSGRTGQNSGRKFETSGGLSFCNFCHPTIHCIAWSMSYDKNLSIYPPIQIEAVCAKTVGIRLVCSQGFAILRNEQMSIKFRKRLMGGGKTYRAILGEETVP